MSETEQIPGLLAERHGLVRFRLTHCWSLDLGESYDVSLWPTLLTCEIADGDYRRPLCQTCWASNEVPLQIGVRATPPQRAGSGMKVLPLVAATRERARWVCPDCDRGGWDPPAVSVMQTDSVKAGIYSGVGGGCGCGRLQGDGSGGIVLWPYIALQKD